MNLPTPGVRIGEYEYFTIDQLTLAIGCPRYVIVNLVRANEFGARKLGKITLISAEEFHEWVKLGRLDYTKRVR